MIVVAAVLDAVPEGYDCAMHVWGNTNEQALETIVAAKPYLKHVFAKLTRYRRDYALPLQLAESIVDSADEFIRTNKNSARYWTSDEILASSTLCENGDENKRDILTTLISDGCHVEASELEAFYSTHCSATKIHVYTFVDGADVSWLDVYFSKHRVWNRMNLSEIIAVRASRTFYIVIAAGANWLNKVPVIFKHPLSMLRDESYITHPLWSARQDFLQLCVAPCIFK